MIAALAQTKRPFRKKLFAGLAVAAGVVLLAFESTRPADTSVERWFWIAVAIGLIGLGVAELISSPVPRDGDGRRQPPIHLDDKSGPR